MIKQLKHFISILLLLGLTTTGYSGNGQPQLATVHLFAETARKNQSRHRDSKLFVYGQSAISLQNLLIIFMSYVNPLEVYNTLLAVIIKIQKMLYNSLHLDKVLQAFLPKLSTSHTSHSSLYIA